MMLYLAQHGAALSKEQDPDRPLSPQGKVDVLAVGGFLGKAGVRVERVIHSGKTRARQTAELLAEAVSPGATLEILGGLNPKDDPAALVARVDDWTADRLVVGHQPFMGRLVARLVAAPGDMEAVALRPGSVVALEQEQGVGWRVAWMIRPDLLGKT